MRALDKQLANDDVALVCGLHSLQGVHAEVVQAALAIKAPGWTVEGHDDYDGEMILVVTQAGQPEAPAYVLNGTKEGICLALVGDDCWKTLASVDRLAFAINLLRQRIETSPYSARYAIAAH